MWTGQGRDGNQGETTLYEAIRKAISEVRFQSPDHLSDAVFLSSPS